METYRLGVDIGGTFTDAILINEETGEVSSAKASTTLKDESAGVMEAIKLVGAPLKDTRLFVHGYTVALNALLTRTGAKTGLLTTHGMRDLMDTGRMWRGFGKHLFNPHWRRPLEERPLVERRLRREIKERLAYDGSVVLPLNEDEVRGEVEFLKKEGVEAIAIMFFNSFVSQAHEQRALEIVKEVFPEVYVQTSSINPVTKEYERQVTVVTGAYTGKLSRDYLGKLGTVLKQAGFTKDVLILQITGGVQSIAAIEKEPLWALYSGPVGGCLGAQAYGKWLGVPNLIIFDVGGTSMDTSIIMDYEVSTASEKEIESGLTVMLPHIEVTSIGSGGGSVIYLDHVGAIRVGPESAGAMPGPACYGRGGVQPCLSDAFLQMGLLHPERFLGGRLILDKALAEQALQTVATPLKKSPNELADAAYELANVQMAEAIRTITVYRGIDPRDFALFAFGSAGPMQACDVAKLLSIPKVIVPTHPGGFSAFGMVTADMRVDYSIAPMKHMTAIDPDELDKWFRELEDKAVGDLRLQGIPDSEIEKTRTYHGMYYGQTWDNQVPAPAPPYDAKTLEKMAGEFHEWYLANYGYKAEELPIIITQMTATATSKLPGFELGEIPSGDKEPLSEALVDRVDVYMGHALHKDTPYFDRGKLRAGNLIEGPAVVVEDLATTVIPKGCSAEVGKKGELIITVPL